jgi:hypothetical protein
MDPGELRVQVVNSMTASGEKSKTDETIEAARRVEQMAFELSQIAVTLCSSEDASQELVAEARAARDHLDNLAIELRKRLRRAQFAGSMRA